MHEAEHPPDARLAHAPSAAQLSASHSGGAPDAHGGSQRERALADGVSHALDPRWIVYRRRVGWLVSLAFALVLSAAAAGAALWAGLSAAPLVTAAVIAAAAQTWFGQWWPAVAFRHASYRIGARALQIRRGVFWRRVIDVPRSRIQHSDVSQGPVERMHGLGTLDVHTAGTTHARVRLSGLGHDRALAIRGHLMQTDDDDVV